MQCRLPLAVPSVWLPWYCIDQDHLQAPPMQLYHHVCYTQMRYRFVQSGK